MESAERKLAMVFQIDPTGPHTAEKDVDVMQILDDERRRVIGLSIRGGCVLKRHHAEEPITVYCVSGSCRFKYGPDLDEINEMKRGTLLALDAGIDHEVEAISDTKLLVSKFK